MAASQESIALVPASRAGEPLPFVGRERELAAFHAHLDAAHEGRGGVLFVGGEPGIGKTRLLLEIGRQARAQGWEVLSGAAYDSEGMPPYLPFVEAVRDYARRCPPDDLRAQLGASAAEVARLVPEVRRRLPDLADSPVVGPELERYRLFESLTEFLLAVAQAGPGRGVLLLLDDLHWADRSSLLLLQHLAHRLAEARLLVAGSYRTVELNRAHPLAPVLADLRRADICERLVLPPLPSDAIVAMVETLTGVRPTANVLDTIARLTDGNPFFVRELALHLQAEGLLDPQRQATSTAFAPAIPDGVREVIDSRVARLSEAANRALEVGAILGDGFSFAAVQRMTAIDETPLLDAIDEAQTAGLLREQGESYVFEHALIRETLYSRLSLTRRRRLHLRAAEALQAEQHTQPPAPGEVADHLRLAGSLADPETTIDFTLRAGEAAVDVFAYEEALRYWRTALEVMKQHSAVPERRLPLLEKLATLASTIGFDHFVESASYWQEALHLCDTHQLVQRGAHARCRLGMMLAANSATMDIPGALHVLREAGSTLRVHPDAESSGYLYVGLGSANVWAARTAEGLAASQRGMQIATQIADGAIWSYAAMNHAWHQISSGDLRDGFGLFERAWLAADRVDGTSPAYRAASFWGNRCFLLGDPQAAASVYQRELDKPRLAAAPTRRLALISSVAAVQARTGNLSAARESLNQLGSHEFYQDSAMLAKPLVAFWSGDWQAAEAAWMAVRDRHRSVGNRWGVADFGYWLGELRFVQGDLPSAADLLTEALGIAVDAPIVPLELKVRAALAMIAADQQMLSEAQAHVTRCAEILDTVQDWRALAGQAALADAVVLASQGGLDRAAGKFSEASEIFERYALPWDTAEVAYRWGCALARTEPREADQLFDRAIEIYVRHGAGGPWINRVWRARLPEKRPQSRHPDGLSEREIQVVRLIAAGKSNREIAQALVISRYTVERHVNHILAKTGAANRTQVAGYAHRHNLEA